MNPEHKPGISFSFFVLAILVSIIASISPNSHELSMHEPYVPLEFKALSNLDFVSFKSALDAVPRVDSIMDFYSNPATKPLVLAFFEKLSGSSLIAERILEECLEYKVAPALAFALAYEESSFDPKAYNRNSDSVDRGIFQLNSLSFPKLEVNDFYDIPTNVRLGIAHLALCLKQGGNDVAALAIYNAGFGKVSKGGTPRRTLDYIDSIAAKRKRLEALFEAQVVAPYSKTANIALNIGIGDNKSSN